MIPRDKLYHHAIGALTVVVTHAAGLILGVEQSLMIGLLLTLGIAITKECWDAARPKRHTTDWLDAAATVAGGAYAAAVLIGVGP